MNKNVTLFLVSIMVFVGPLSASNFGIKAGASLSFAGEDSAIYNAENLYSGKIGIFCSISITKFFSVQPEAYFAIKGGRYYSAAHRATESAHLNYLEVPVLFNIHLLEKRIDLFLGPYFAYLVSSTEIDEDHDWTWKENEVNNYDLGVSLGMRWHFIKRIFVEVQFNNGFNKAVFDPNPVPQSINRVHKNKTLSLLIGFGF